MNQGDDSEANGPQDEHDAAEAAAGQAARGQPQRVYQQLRQMILDNELQPGNFVLQEELGERLGVSRTPIREALIRLEREGLIEIRPRHGMRVLPVSVEAMREIYAILAALEAEAARIVAEAGATPELIKALEDAQATMDDAVAAGDIHAWADANERYHNHIVEASGYARLIDMVAIIHAQSVRAQRMTLALRAMPTTANEEHREIIAALREGDSERAAKLHGDHRRKSGHGLIAILEKLDLLRG